MGYEYKYFDRWYVVFKKNTAVTGFTFGLVSSTDGSDITTGTPVGYYTLDGGTQTAIGDVTPVHEGNGQWSFDLTAGEMNGDVVGLTFTHASAITAHFTIKTDTKIVSELQDITTAQVNTECDTALTDYDPPTNTEMNARTLVAAAYFDPAADTVATVTSVTNQVTADMTAISGDATAADNLELQYDTTGLTGETFPATQAQVGNLATGSAAISVVSESDTVTTGTEVNTYAVTDEVDQVYHEVTDVAGVLELYYQFDVGGNGVAAICQFTGRLTSANDSIGVYAYNWAATSWDQVGTLAGTGGTSDGVEIFNLLTRHTGTGANLGKVRIRGYAASGLTSATLYIDQALISYAVVAQSVGYANGAIWFDSNASNTNTEVYVDGTADNPVSTEAAVNTLISSTGLTRVEVAIDSSVTFATSHTSEFWTGEHWILGQGGQDLSSSHFRGADVSGVAIGTSAIDYEECRIGTATIDQFHMVNCGFDGTLTFGEAGNYIISGGHSAVAGSTTPIIDTGAAIANVNLTMPDWHNGVEIRNLNATGTDLFSISGIGQIIYAASSSGAVNQRGRWKVTNTGGVTITYDDPSQNEIDTLADTNELQTDDVPGLIAGLNDLTAAQVNAECDTALTDYDGPTNAEMEARTPTAAQLAYIVANAATGLPVTFTTAGGSTTAAVINQVDGSAGSATDDQYNGRLLVFTNGTLKGVVTDITDYVGSTTTATITAIPTAPTSSHTARLI